MRNHRLSVYTYLFLAGLLLTSSCQTQRATPTPQPSEAPPTISSAPTPTEASPAAEPTAVQTTVTPSELVGMIWQWAELTETEPAGQSVVPDPESYTLALMPDGNASVKADCNRVSWPYRLEGNALTFDALFATTLAMCGPDSLYEQYLKLLGNGGLVSLENGRFVLELRNDAGLMVFDHGGSAEGSAVTGTVIAEGNPALPEGAMLEVRVEDVSLADAPATQVAGQTQEITRLPANFEAPYDAALIKPENAYGLTVRVTDADGSLLYINTQAYDVLTRGNPSRDVEVLVEPVGGQPPTGSETRPGGLGIDPATITLDMMGLPYSWQANLVPATAYDNSQPPGPKGLPEHIQINFGVTNPADKQPGDPVIYIIPVEAYKAMYAENGDQGVATTVGMHLGLLKDRPASFPRNSIPVLPLEEAAGLNDLAVQGNYPEFGSFAGLRFVGRFAQDANPVTNDGLRYIFQGYAGEGGEYMIAFFYPVSTSKLPNTMAEVPAEEQSSVTDAPERYLNEKADMLNALPTSDWEPDLAVLDSVLGSLKFETNASGGELLGLWQWQRSSYNDDTELQVNDPTRYTIEFKADGTLPIQADCNRLSWTYTREGNNVTINAFGPTTLATCPPDSQDQQFLKDLSEVTGYVMHEGNLVLNLMADAGNMIFAR